MVGTWKGEWEGRRDEQMASQRRAKHRSRKKPPLENEIREILVRAFGFGFGFGVVVAVAAVYLHSSTFVPTSSVLQCHIRLHRFVASLRNEPSTPPRPAPSRQGPRNPFFVLSARHENRRGSYFGLGAAPRRPAQPSPMPIEKRLYSYFLFSLRQFSFLRIVLLYYEYVLSSSSSSYRDSIAFLHAHFSLLFF